MNLGDYWVLLEERGDVLRPGPEIKAVQERRQPLALRLRDVLCRCRTLIAPVKKTVATQAAKRPNGQRGSSQVRGSAGGGCWLFPDLWASNTTTTARCGRCMYGTCATARVAGTAVSKRSTSSVQAEEEIGVVPCAACRTDAVNAAKGTSRVHTNTLGTRGQTTRAHEKTPKTSHDANPLHLKTPRLGTSSRSVASKTSPLGPFLGYGTQTVRDAQPLHTRNAGQRVLRRKGWVSRISKCRGSTTHR